MTARLIGISGPLGAGKSLAARILSVELGLPVVPFAAPLKSMLETLGVPREHIYGTQAQKAAPLDILGGKSARYALQTLGTDWGRNMVTPNLWVNAWLAHVTGGAIADDVRFAGEAEAIHARGGIVIQLIRSRTDLDKVPEHSSEDFQAVPFNVQIVNDKCPTILKERLVTTLTQVAGPLAAE